MSKQWMFGIAGVIAVSCLVILLSSQSLQSQEEAAEAKPQIGKNMQVFTGDRAFESTRELQEYMRDLTISLGVQCSYCHDMKDFTKDVPELHKDEARFYMNMVHEMNDKYFKDKPEAQMNCFVCHRGREKPVFSKAEWMKIQEEEK